MNHIARSRTTTRAGAVLMVLAAITIWVAYGRSPASPAFEASAAGSAIMRTDSIARVAREARPSVVFLHMVSGSRPPRGTPHQPGKNWMAPPPWAQNQVKEGLGSGIVVDSTGTILTNAHVIAGADVVHLRTNDGDDIDTAAVGVDPITDLALLRASDATGLRPAPLGDSDRIDVGDWVVAIGSPFGLHHTVTVGIISAKARQLDDAGIELLQTDAPINPGNSGGPLLDLQGRVVGINSGLVSGAGESIGFNFAIPINLARAMLPQLRSGVVRHGWMGVASELLSPRRLEALGLPGRATALQVTALAPSGPAGVAGLKVGDLILGLAGNRAVPVRSLSQLVATTTPGSVLRLRVRRANAEFDVSVTLSERPE